MNELHKISEAKLYTCFNRVSHDLGRTGAVGIIDRLLSIDEVTQLVLKHRSTIYRWMKSGKFPRSQKREGSTLWKLPDAQKFIQGQDYQDSPHTIASSPVG